MAAGLVAGWLVALALLLPATLSAAAAAEEDPGAELARLAKALRAQPTLRNYQRLAGFADRYAESELSAQASFALGMVDFEKRRWGAARERFDAARASQVLGDYATLFLARAEIEQGAFEAAQQTLAEFSPAAGASLLEDEASVLEADLRVRAGRAGEGVDLLRRHPEVWRRPALLQALGEALAAAGEPVAAAETLNAVYYRFPLTPQAEASDQLLARLRSELKADYPHPSEELRRLRAETLWALKAYRGARSAYLDLSVRASEATRAEARVRAAVALFHLGGVSQSCEELRAIAGASGPAEAEFLALQVRCGLRTGDTTGVEANLAVLELKFPGHEATEAALAAAAEAALVRGEKAGARDLYRRLLEAFPQGNSTAEAHWKLAWLAYRAREAEATQLMEEHLERFPDSPYLPRALYWRARLAVSAADGPLAERLLELLRQVAPRDYPAQQGEILDAQLQGAPAGDGDADPLWLLKLRQRLQPTAPDPQSEGSELRALIETAEALERLSRSELAEHLLEAAIEQQPHSQLYFAAARLAFAQGKYGRATELLHRAFPAYWRHPLEQLPRWAWEILFPLPYWELIQREARRAGLDPYLVAGLIRQESRFEAEAVSSAGARGLMQLMPGTARLLAGGRVRRQRLFDPALNIRLGTRFLAQLLRQYGGNLEKAVAGYNAGSGRVAEWASQPYGEPAEFVESIPIAQTREFVHVVLRNHRFYRDLYPRR